MKNLLNRQMRFMAFVFPFILASCGGGSGACSVIGEACEGGIYAGTIQDHGRSYDLIVMPGGCDGTTAPTCAGTDTHAIKMPWAGDTVNNTGALSDTDGPQNTQDVLRSAHAQTPAASYCDDLVYDGKTDWYLPAIDELQVLYDNHVAIGGFDLTSTYHSSTEQSAMRAWSIRFSDGFRDFYNKTLTDFTRCVRRI